MTLQRQTFTGFHNLALCADVGGQADAPPVILLHGGGQTRHSWGRAARRLAQTGYHTLAMDLRGHGESAWAEDGDYSTDSFVADLNAVIDTLDQPPVLVGASLGGSTALLAMGEAETVRARALVLVDVVPRMSPEGVRHIRDFMMGNPEGFTNLEEAAAAVSRYIPNRPKPPTNEGLLKNLRLKDDGRYYWHWDPAFQARGARERLADLHLRMENAASKIHVPTLLVRGRQSDVVSEEGARLLLELIPHAEYVDIEGAGHMVAGDRNDVFNEAIESFLQRLA
ncbi:alpha/beta fold hydrolase [Pseudomonas sp. NPDC086251]|uniref:alpha/beta fold hydrolase n=1 Tax=Pseudomonas sp. NPDC086251 TaxID=3364431 RepID=UPI003837287A